MISTKVLSSHAGVGREQWMGRLKEAAVTGSAEPGLGSTKLEGCPRKQKNQSVFDRERSGHLDASSLNRKAGSCL